MVTQRDWMDPAMMPCFAYCGDDRCSCSANPMHPTNLAPRPYWCDIAFAPKQGQMLLVYSKPKYSGSDILEANYGAATWESPHYHGTPEFEKEGFWLHDLPDEPTHFLLNAPVMDNDTRSRPPYPWDKK